MTVQVVDALGNVKPARDRVPAFTPETQAKLPQPTGYRILVAIPEVEETTEGGIIKAQETMRVEEIATVVGFVLAMGPDCYKDANRFSEPYCKEGDFVVFRAFSGTRISVHGKEFRLINDDSVEAVVDDPRGIVRAG